jgi:hypothetical protein
VSLAYGFNANSAFIDASYFEVKLMVKICMPAILIVKDQKVSSSQSPDCHATGKDFYLSLNLSFVTRECRKVILVSQ